MQHSDRPITRPRDDVLGRADFARTLAHSIDNLAIARDGFVIGLVGEWGSGKSSVIELTLRFLRHIDMARVAEPPRYGINGFDACNVGKLEAMAGAFEKVEQRIADMEALNLNLVLWERSHRGKTFLKWLGSEEEGSNAYEYWRRKRIVDLNPRNIVIRFSPWLIAGRAELASALISDIARASGEKLGDEVRQAFASLLQRLSEFAPLAGAGVDVASGGAFGGLFSAALDLSNNLSARLSQGPTLDDVRERLRLTLARLENRKLLIVIDDLDRLTPREAVEMVSLIKSLGDLPNVIYLLSYDEKKLSALITEALRIEGAEFLEKIVQYPVHLPPLDDNDLARLLEADLSRVLGNFSPGDAGRLGRAWYFVVQHYVRTPRDVRRLANSYSVAWSGLSDHTDPVDLLLLEVVRLHEPELYKWVRRNLANIVD